MPTMPTLKKTALFALGAVICFHLAFAGLGLSVLIVGFFYCLLRMTETESFSELYWCGLVAGMLCYSPPLAFLWRIFGVFAVSLWLVMSAWLLAFLILAWWWRRRYGLISFAIIAPFFWTGLEYFRGELYYLRFSWLSAGYAFSGSAQLRWLAGLGVYGIGFVAMALAAILFMLPLRRRLIAGAVLLVGGLIHWPVTPIRTPVDGRVLKLAGIQLEFPARETLMVSLHELASRHPDADVLVLSEYTLDGQVPAEIRDFCRERKKYLIIGGKAPASGDNFYDTAFVVGPTGDIVFSQAKSVPVQFFRDGLTALEQRVWYSPWGKIGIGICYDASYRRVVDGLIQQGAQALIFPTMDVEDWGAQEHKLNALVTQMRAAEYQVPVFRLASSGISEAVNADGTVQARADYPGQAEFITAEFHLPVEGRLPLGHWLAPACTALTAGLVWWLAFTGMTKRFRREKAPQPGKN